MPTNNKFVDDCRLSKQAFEYMNRIRRNKQLCDVTLIAGHVEIAAHKLVLASCSLYFHMKFVMARTGETLIIKEIEGRILELLIDYIYSSKLSIEPQNVKDLLIASNLLMLPEVWEQCCEFLKDSLNPANCLEISDWADRHKFLKLKTDAVNYIDVNFEHVIRRSEFQKASHESFLVLLKSIKEKCVTTCSEKLMECILAWIRYDVEIREPHLDGLLDCVDMSSIAPKYLLEKLDDPLLKGNIQYITKVMDVIKSQYLQAPPKEILRYSGEELRRLNIQDPNPLLAVAGNGSVTAQTSNPNNIHLIQQGNNFTAPNVQSSVTVNSSVAGNEDILIVAGRKSGDRLSIEQFNFKSKQWTIIPVFKKNHLNEGAATIFLDTQLYMISGRYTDVVEVYDLAVNNWIQIEPFLGKRGYMGVTTLNNTIYAVGGSNGIKNEVYSTAKVYNLENGNWEPIKAMSMARHGHGLVVLNKKIYVVGGISKECMNHVEYYNPEKNNWSPVKSMIFRRSAPAVAVLNGILYVIGGCSNNNPEDFLKTVEIYNPKYNSWSLTSDMHVKRCGAGAITVNQHIYVFGGINESGRLRSVEMYDPQTSSWTLLPDMLEPKIHVSATLMNPAILRSH